MASVEIFISGTGHAIRPAERAILRLHVESKELPSQAEATKACATTARALRESLVEYCPQDETTGRTLPDAAIAHFSISTMNTNSHPQRDKDRQYTTTLYSTRVAYTVKFKDFTVLNKLATQFSSTENVKVDNIDWELTDATTDSIKSGARKIAAQDAIQRAYDYANVFAGVPEEECKKRVLPVRVTEQSYYSRSTRPQLHIGKRQRMEGTRMVESEDLVFEPEDVRLEVKVDAKFEVDRKD